MSVRLSAHGSRREKGRSLTPPHTHSSKTMRKMLSYSAHLSELEWRVLPCGEERNAGYGLLIFWMPHRGSDYASRHL